jgi:hypothetical protein
MRTVNIKIKKKTIDRIIWSLVLSFLILSIIHFFGKFDYFLFRDSYTFEYTSVEPTFTCPLKEFHKDLPAESIRNASHNPWNVIKKIKYSFIYCFDNHWMFLILTTLGFYIGIWLIENVSIRIIE